MKSLISLLTVVLSITSIQVLSANPNANGSYPSNQPGGQTFANNLITMEPGSKISIRPGVLTKVFCEGGTSLGEVRTSCTCSINAQNRDMVELFLITVTPSGSVKREIISTYQPTGYGNSREVNSNACAVDLKANPLCR